MLTSVLDPNTLSDADSRPEGGTLARLEWEIGINA